MYRVASEVPPDFELRDGVVIPPGEELEGEVLRGRDGFIEVNIGLEGCLVSFVCAYYVLLVTVILVLIQDAKGIAVAQVDSERYSDTFGLLLPCPPKSVTLPSTPQRPSSPQPSATPPSLLPTLPPLFHPPPYSPSHPVFVRLSRTASVTSAQYRSQAERAIEAFIDAQVAQVLDKERHLRGQVEVIWSRWRDNWKQETDSGSPPDVHSSHGGLAPVREFSPTAVSESGPATQGSAGSELRAIPTRRASIPSTHTTGPSMLSQSLRQSNFIPPPQSTTSTPSPQLPTPINSIKNPLDDSFAVSASLRIRASDALRARESAKDSDERRRKRMSSRTNAPPVVPEEQSPDNNHVTPAMSRNGVAEGKRKVTFQADVKEEDGGSQLVPRRGDEGVSGGDDGGEEGLETRESFEFGRGY